MSALANPIVVVGLGELGSVFARGFLKSGYPVIPVTRQMSMASVAQEVAAPTAVLIAVGENDLHPVLEQLPEVWKDRTILIQNELLPRDWQQHQIETPTVISVWFEKKKGMDSKVVLPSPIWGPRARLVFDALATLDLPSYLVDSLEEMTYELVRKNLYILTTNIAGLELPEGCTVQQLRDEHAELMEAVAEDVLKIQSALTGIQWEKESLIDGMLEAFDGDPEHKCMGRSAPARLARALKIAQAHHLSVPTLETIARDVSMAKNA